MNALDIHVLLHVVEYMEMCDVAQLRMTCESNQLLFSSSNVIGQALVNQYGAKEGVKIAFDHCHEKVTWWICRNFTDQLDWSWIFIYHSFSEEFIKEFLDKTNWYSISAWQNLSEEFIREFKDRVDWVWISWCQKLSEDFIKEFKDKVDWKNISVHQKLSEEFIKKFQDRVCWISIFWHQKLSEAFREEFRNIVHAARLKYYVEYNALINISY